MKIYLVGGAVRDRLLGLPQQDQDYVVVGTTPDQMLRQGYKPVGKEFPVFLHPETGAEYALARTERKTDWGYRGFSFQTDPAVTLEQDLLRRDLTINAMAQDDNGKLIDPYGGTRDLENCLLRHVSPAFAEDPVRVLRVARFAARYANRGFRIADETLDLMRQMVKKGEVDYLVPERVWAETLKALAEPTPSAYLRALRDCEALKIIFPEIDALYGVPQSVQYHPEIDTGIHAEMAVDVMARLAPGDTLMAWCALTHDLGKALTPKDILPRHIGHEEAGVEPIRQLSKRLKIPAEYQAVAILCCRLHLKLHMLNTLRPPTILKMMEQLDAFRKPMRLKQFVMVCEADKRGRLGMSELDYPEGQQFLKMFQQISMIKASSLAIEGLSGLEVAAALRKARLHTLARLRDEIKKKTLADAHE